MRFESGLKEIRCAPPDPGGLTVIGRPITRPVAVAHSVTWFVSCGPAAMTVPSGLYRTVESAGSSGVAAGSVSSRSFFLVDDVPQLDAALSARDRQRPPVGAEVDP